MFNKSNCLFEQQKYEEALKKYDEAFLAMNEENKKNEKNIDNTKSSQPNPNEPIIVDSWTFDMEKIDSILNLYEKVCPFDENTSSIYNNIGLCLYNLQKYPQAEKCFDRALNINKKDALYLINKAKVLHEMGNDKESEEYVELTLDALKVPSAALTKNLFAYIIKEIDVLNKAK